MDFRDFTIYCGEQSEKHPDKKYEIRDILQLCYSEIGEGGSEIHEVELAIESIEQAIEDD